MIHKKYWTYNKLDNIKVEELSNSLGITSTISRVLLNRGIANRDEAKKFLYSSLTQLHDPFLLKDMGKVVDRIKEAIRNNEKICIYGDYDVDGISSTSIMIKYFNSINHPVSYYIPSRMEEGYGLNKDAIEKIFINGTRLIITVDCGITSVEEVKFANSLGIDMIITDHHECQNVLPDAYGIINPKQKDCSYPFDKICGCGLVFKLIQALTPAEVFKTSIYDYLDIAAIATVADVVSLTDENRVIVKNGLEYISESINPGIQALLKVCGFEDRRLNAGNIAFGLAPRINAAGRISSADAGVQLLTATDVNHANKIAQLLNEENRYRQEIEMNILNEAIDIIERNSGYASDNILIIYNEGWHPGVIGIVASRIVEKYYKPTVILGVEEGIAKGSARSIPGFDLFDAMNKCKDLFIKFGGHEQAAGLSINVENIEAFRQQINLIAKQTLTEEDFIPKVFYDDILKIEDISEQLIDEIQQLEPFGMGNPAPKFISQNLRTVDIRGIGIDKKHIKFKLESNGNYIDGIGFGLGDFQQLIELDDEIDIVFSPEYNVYNGNRKLQFNIKDIKIKHSLNYRKHPVLKEYYQNFLMSKYETDKRLIDIPLKILKGEKDKIVREKVEGASKIKPILILANTLNHAYRLLSLLEYKKSSSLNSISIGFNQPNTDNLDYEVYVVINPVVDKIQYKRYNNIILYDMFYSLGQLKAFVNQNHIERTIFLYEDGDEESNLSILKSIIPTREQLVAIYKYLKDNKSKRISHSFEKIYDDIKCRHNLIINEALFNNALAIFVEGSLLTYNFENNAYNIHMLEPTCKVDLNKLKYTQYLETIKYQYNDFKNIWLQLL
ncbi:single-stranded-DNA-specific exonuclease RecJ [Alkaliphilus sp. B6464]|uniref:single-stranded-DNA-specific exonuclease RecJ n=1 Tax=Alkaliphilus sp. B6464 TaxID=2731219 RepID=UPI001BAC411E|nr:single-stranded-DNA-specific exonuclease RecJ [Alkaliphilus sp. B6464]QUH20541.1 single-stranded-DNA-specific exonuclease RecJ [Alkaliphilus sp. B6464]